MHLPMLFHGDIVDILSIIPYAYLRVFNCIFRNYPRRYIHVIFFYITHDSLYSVWKVICFLFVSKGLKSEGLYRVSGFSDSVEEVKMAFDKGLCSFGSACCNRFIDFCQLTTWRWQCVLTYVYISRMEHFRLMRKWHICEGLISIWECRSGNVPWLARILSQCGQGGLRGIQTLDIFSLP